MIRLVKHEALVHTLRHGGDRNCEHLRSPKAVRAYKEPMYLDHGKVLCQKCKEDKAKIVPH